MTAWMDALKEWNAKKGGKWSIPKKGSAEYDAVKKLMKHEKKESPAMEKKEHKKSNKKSMDSV